MTFNLLKALKMTNLRIDFLLDLFLVTCAAILSIFYSQKGFAGYDLSPMISATNLALMNAPQNYAISNPMPPGLIFLTYLSCLVFGMNYPSFFYGNIVFILMLFTIAYFVMSKTKVSTENPRIFLLFRVLLLSILVPTLITDGHFYISDTSNVFVAFLMYILLVVACDEFREPGQGKTCYNYCVPILLILSPFCLFLRPNIGIVGFAFIYSCLILFELRNYKSLFSLSKKILYISFIITLAVFLYVAGLSKLVNFDIKDYISTIKHLSQTRGTFSLLYNTVDTQITALFPNPFKLSALSSLAIKQQISFFLNYILINSVALSSIFLLWRVIREYFLSYEKIARIVLLLISIVIIFDYQFGYATSINLLLFFVSMFLVFAILSWHCYIYVVQNGKFFELLPIIIVFMGFTVFALPSSVIISQNRDVLSSNFPLLAITYFSGVAYFILLDKKIRQEYFLIFSLAIVVLSFNLYEGFDRIKIIIAGPPAVLRDYNSVVDNEFFKKIKTSMYHKILEEDIEHICSSGKQICVSGKVMFGPRLEYLYARYHFLPPNNLPLWWHYSTAYQKSDLDKIHSMLKSGKINYIILGKYDNENIDRADMDDLSFDLMLNSGIFRLYEKTNLLRVYEFVH